MDLKSAETALILIDMITDFDFEDGERLMRATRPMVKSLSALRKRLKNAGIPVIYVNDNFGKWQEDFKTIVRNFTADSARGGEIVSIIRPESDDYYILKPHRSAFYSTSLMLLLERLGIRQLILTGITTDICVLFSANDAYMRGFKISIPSDCVSAVKREHTRTTLNFVKRVLDADTTPSTQVRFV